MELHHVGEICLHLDTFELQYGQSLLLILVLKLRSFVCCCPSLPPSTQLGVASSRVSGVVRIRGLSSKWG